MSHAIWLVLGLGAMAFAIPGPCSYDGHDELDCDFSSGEATCPEGLACAPDDHCKPEDVACDRIEDNVVCNGVCINTDAFLTDVNNCGGCGLVCDEGDGCCSGDCVAVDVDERCGDCNISCTADQTCFESACRAACGVDVDCPGTGEVCCDGLCNDGTVNERCGACDVACGADETCADQVCRASCSNDGDCPASRCCDGLCVIAGDPAHCGACNESCGGDTVCLDDTCAPECAADRPCTGAKAGQDCCGARCVDTSADDDDHCGACDSPCGGTTFCNDGECRTGSDRDCCSSNCNNCGADACVNNQCVDCDIYDQNCGSDATCVPGFPNLPPAGVCIAALPPPAPDRNETCTPTGGTAECLAGLDCVAVNTEIDVCVAFCDPFVFPSEQCALTEGCVPVDVGGGITIGLCAPSCNLDASFACVHGDISGTCVPAAFGQCTGDQGSCVPPGPVAEGATCETLSDCAADLVCDPTDSTCRRLCRDADTPCAGGGTCTNVLSCDQVGACR